MTLDSIELTETVLIFDYTVNNYSSQRIYLLNNLPDRRDRSGLQVDPNAVYTTMEPGPTLSLSKKMLLLPAGLAVKVPEVPFVSQLEPRWTMSETVRLPLPIEARHPYLPQPPASEPGLVSQFTFTLGYVFENHPLNLKEIPLPDENRRLIPEYEEIVQRQRLKRSAPVTAGVAVTL